MMVDDIHILYTGNIWWSHWSVTFSKELCNSATPGAHEKTPGNIMKFLKIEKFSQFPKISNIHSRRGCTHIIKCISLCQYS